MKFLNPIFVSSGSITGSFFGTASHSLTSSYSLNSRNTLTSSYSLSGLSSSYSLTSSYVLNSVSSSYSLNSLSSSYSLNSDNSVSSSYSVVSGNSYTSNYSTQSLSSSYSDFAFTSSMSLRSELSGVIVKDDGTTLSQNIASIDFTGNAVTTTNLGNAITVNITTGSVSLAGSASSVAYYNDSGLLSSSNMSISNNGSWLNLDRINVRRVGGAGAIRLGEIGGYGRGEMTMINSSNHSMYFTYSDNSTGDLNFTIKNTKPSLQVGDSLIYNGTEFEVRNISNYSGSFTGSFNGVYTGNGSGLTGIVATIEATTTDVSSFTEQTNLTVTHNLNTATPIVQVFDTNDEIFIPQTIKKLNDNQIQLIFNEATSGTVVVAKGGHIVSGSVVSSSYSLTSSYNLNSVSSSYSAYSLNSATSSYVLSTVSSSYSQTASYVSNTISSSYALTSSYAANAGSSLTTQYTGSNLSTATQLINFTGNAVSATNSGNNVTVNINTGSGVSTGAMEVLGITFNHVTTEIITNTFFETGYEIHRVVIRKLNLFNGTPTITLFTTGSTPIDLTPTTTTLTSSLSLQHNNFDITTITNSSSGSLKLTLTPNGATIGVGKVNVYYTRTSNS